MRKRVALYLIVASVAPRVASAVPLTFAPIQLSHETTFVEGTLGFTSVVTSAQPSDSDTRQVGFSLSNQFDLSDAVSMVFATGEMFRISFESRFQIASYQVTGFLSTVSCGIEPPGPRSVFSCGFESYAPALPPVQLGEVILGFSESSGVPATFQLNVNHFINTDIGGFGAYRGSGNVPLVPVPEPKSGLLLLMALTTYGILCSVQWRRFPFLSGGI